MARGSLTHYARPPQMPSMLMSRKTKKKLRACESALNIPAPDSIARAVRMTACTTAGRPNSLAGRGGSPNEIDERDKNTVVW